MKQLKKPRSLTGAFSFSGCHSIGAKPRWNPLFLNFIRGDALTDAEVYLYLSPSIGILQKIFELINDAS
ncbi:hypothetical protein [Fibrobacter sp. UWB11]|uniref:hypothetical protein n=1 Tax=Fibrobacter sp. UWB11 TaxID=1896202 RepID=UPI001588049E|nr:hypothetical protein [Fibrobacter sp. UWB11]